MALIKFSGGPLDGQERDIQDPNTIASQFPGYATVEQRLEPEQGTVTLADWSGDDTMAAGYPDRDTNQQSRSAEGRGAETREGARAETQTDQKPQDQNAEARSGETTGAQKRDTRNQAADAKRRGAESRSSK